MAGATSAPAPASSFPAVPWLPITGGGDQLLCLSVMVAGRPATALLDSGASRSVLDRDWASGAGITLSSRHELAGLTASVTAQISRPLPVTAGTVVLPPIVPAVLDLASISAAARRRIDLVLGQECFLQNEVEIDPDMARVRLGPRRAVGTDEAWLSLHRTPDKLFCVDVRLDRGLRARAILDLGSSIPLYVKRDLAEAGRLLEGRPTSTSASVGVEGISLSTVTRLDCLQIGDHRLRGVPLNIPDTWNLDAPIVIGAPLLWKFRTIFDLGRRRILLTPGTNYEEPLIADRSGLHVIGGDNCLLVIHVSPGSPAALAKLEAGDEIVAVNGDAVTPRFLAENRNLGRRPAGIPYRLAVRDKPARTMVLADYY
ncbi:retropepsin-like aspartic protease [Allosphingosinicella deserti]|uniref:retropepsin-like aspartic protease n=1 Tax=Allosphingosinicella deserti TaxID=2116704 RepID=UPI001304F469|nr:aspartyl protease family protein [Sphingomonas deserti]